jgi:transcriptional regulator with XRE-family HTH domain
MQISKFVEIYFTKMPKTITKIFGDNVRKERLKKGLSQEDFAEISGFHRTYIGMLERAERNITLSNLEKIAKALDIEIAELLKPNL